MGVWLGPTPCTSRKRVARLPPPLHNSHSWESPPVSCGSRPVLWSRQLPPVPAARSSSSVVKCWSALATMFLCTAPPIPAYCLGLRFSRRIRLAYRRESLTLCWILPILSLQKSRGSSCPGTCHSHHPSKEVQPRAYTSLRALPTGPVGGGLVLDSQIAWMVYCVDRCLLQDVASHTILMYGTFIAGDTLWPGRRTQSPLPSCLASPPTWH